MSEHDSEAVGASGVTVRDDPGRNRYEAVVAADGVETVAGVAVYELREGTIVFLHTEVAEGFGGRGIGGTIVRESLDDVRARGLRVRAVCPFYRKFFRQHPEYADLLGR